MTDRLTLFVDIIIPVAISKEFTYRVPFELNPHIQPFVRVVVPFGKGKFVTGIVTRVHEEIPQEYQAKYIEVVLDDTPLISAQQYQLWKWIAAYYMAPIGDVMNAALPANFKLASETIITLHPDFDSEITLSEREAAIVDALMIKEFLSLKDVSEIVGIKTIQPIIKRMIERRIVISQEEINDKFTAKTALFVRIADAFTDEEILNDLFASFQQSKAKAKQEQVLLEILHLGGLKNGVSEPIPRKTLEENGCSLSAINTLEKAGILVSERIQISRLKSKDDENLFFPQLSEHQKNALAEIKENFEQKDIVLLQGVTGSGKTEVYIHLIREQIEKGKQVLFLVPEIALTTQLIQRLSNYFGNQVGIYHSKFNGNERVEIWNQVLANNSEKYRVLVGARSALFLPFQNLGLVIVDEEHEGSFKQHDPSPRYHARDMAIVLSKLFGAKTLLGSATPSIETVYNVQQERYGKVELTKRFSEVALPEVFVADMKKERIEKTVNGHFSSFLLREMKEALERNEQIILFQNRRGYTPIWSCEVCSFSPNCKNCDTTLNYHKHHNVLKCHYCSYQIPPIGTCPQCGSNKLKMLGFGTEKIEDDLALLFPNARISRMDFDTTRNKNSHQQIISDFESRNIDILIGTQMVAKGLDFDHVGLVGILDADLLLHKVDFRAFERSFQLMTQVAGRAGRRDKRGRVIIQTSSPHHWVIQKTVEHNFADFAANELVERRNYHYPPFYKLIRFTIKHRDPNLVGDAAEKFAKMLRESFHERVIGPEFPIIARIQNFYIKEILLKVENNAPLKQVKERIAELTDQFYSVPTYKPVRLIIDVDPA
jgi:primosomal protein N' (replication factor Y) (superfamily II helicase)